MKRNSRHAFTILELLIYSTIFVITAIVFIGVLVSITRVQVRQAAASEVAQQSQFLIQTIQRYVENSSLIDMPIDTATSTLKLRMVSGTDPTYIYVSSTDSRVYLIESTGAPQPLTSPRVNVSSLVFRRRQNPGGHDSVSVTFQVDYATSNVQQRFSQAIDTAVSRVSAAVFDSDLGVNNTNQYYLGTSTGTWKGINNKIFFSGANVGVASSGVFAPTALFQVQGGHVYIDSTTSSTGALVMRSSDGVCWRVAVNTAGSFTTSTMTCP